jgi:hypothetical protein
MFCRNNERPLRAHHRSPELAVRLEEVTSGRILALEKRLSRGVSANTNYTWSHCIGDLTDGNRTGSDSRRPGNPNVPAPGPQQLRFARG